MTERMFAKSRSKPTSVSGADSKRQRNSSSCTSASSPGAPNSSAAATRVGHARVARATHSTIPTMVAAHPAVSRTLGEKDLARRGIFELERAAGGQDRRPDVARRHIGLAEIFVGFEQIGF